jgi:hypothetical protein
LQHPTDCSPFCPISRQPAPEIAIADIKSLESRRKWGFQYRLACRSGHLAYLAGRIPKKLYATASSPTEGVIQRK